MGQHILNHNPLYLSTIWIVLVAVEQQTASGMRSTGVKQIPSYPDLSFTLVKNTPTTTESSGISEKGTGILVFRISTASERMAICFSVVWSMIFYSFLPDSKGKIIK